MVLESSAQIVPVAPGTAEKPYFGIDVPLMRHLGLQPVHIEDGLCQTRLPAHPALVNSRGDVHGGTLMAVLDFTLSGAARSHAPLETGVITIDMSTHFLAAARGELTLEARCMRRGARIAFCEGEVKDAAGNVVCVARAAFKLVPLAAGGN
ncbi:PaaI family thioesterase [Cupriavidus gilardii]|uniref:PaaI family thioesterase n=1 Tax=Cupriavidus gilardii TaxID=82541 RepID=A0A6N1BDM7_9BURK|nr:PaaI family thioesterase [Cupriavidus gilardii]QQE07078.1 PaaI family thioesterase [Cupriavidus sp. ISTL7]KAB0596718.1 PaaI family thioesterase [Cupriavidus gilardii]MCT9013629.1 PaaI family thioesterase [Cupriavidus gilardii]MCT9051817.1 PaaI family thioesterase [Cupriavidus gilardii]MCT9072294.1 PaaI family thioesterase [Cupriavidus gilardii]